MIRRYLLDTGIAQDFQDDRRGVRARAKVARALGHRHIMYGSDFPVTHLRGRCVAVGDSFVWLSAHNLKLEVAYGRPELPLVGHEALRTLKVAALSLGWTDSQVEDVFYGNAAALFAKQGLPR